MRKKQPLAITGQNGTGKSNILDAICWGLGLTALKQVRCANQQELVYKQGQAGVTRASVTLEFNNEHPPHPIRREFCISTQVRKN